MNGHERRVGYRRGPGSRVAVAVGVTMARPARRGPPGRLEFGQREPGARGHVLVVIAGSGPHWVVGLIAEERETREAPGLLVGVGAGHLPYEAGTRRAGPRREKIGRWVTCVGHCVTGRAAGTLLAQINRSSAAQSAGRRSGRYRLAAA